MRENRPQHRERNGQPIRPEETTHWEKTRPAPSPLRSGSASEGYAAEIFSAFGWTWTRREQETAVPIPARAVRSHNGTKVTKRSPHSDRMPRGPDCNISQVIEGPTSSSHCASTTLFRSTGTAHRLTSRTKRSSGISKLTRLVRVLRGASPTGARRRRDRDELVRVLQPHGGPCNLDAIHLWHADAGVREGHSRTRTSFCRQLRDRSSAPDG